MQLQTIPDTSNREIIQLVAKLDIPVHVVASPTFLDYGLPQMQHGIQAHVLHPKVNLRDALPMPSATTLAGPLRRHSRILFDEKVKIAARDVKFVNLLVDAVTVNGIKFANVQIVHPSLLPEVIPLQQHEMSS
jgi:hypothetical protein